MTEKTEIIEVNVEPQKKSFIAVEEHRADPGFNIWSEIIADSCVKDLYTQDYHRVYQESIIPKQDTYYITLDKSASRVKWSQSKPSGSRYIKMTRIEGDGSDDAETMPGKYWLFSVSKESKDDARYGLIAASTNISQKTNSVVDTILPAKTAHVQLDQNDDGEDEEEVSEEEHQVQQYQGGAQPNYVFSPQQVQPVQVVLNSKKIIILVIGFLILILIIIIIWKNRCFWKDLAKEYEIEIENRIQ